MVFDDDDDDDDEDDYDFITMKITTNKKYSIPYITSSLKTTIINKDVFNFSHLCFPHYYIITKYFIFKIHINML